MLLRIGAPVFMSQHWIHIVPNVLSTLRLGLAASFWAWPAEWRVPIVVIAGLSDFADGYIARRFTASSWAGGLLDAIADKAFVLSVLVTLMMRGYIQHWQVAMLLARDAVVITMAIYTAIRREWAAFRRMPSRRLGKFTTALIILFYATALLFPRPEQHADDWLFWPAGLCSVLAGADYLALFLREHRKWLAEQRA